MSSALTTTFQAMQTLIAGTTFFQSLTGQNAANSVYNIFAEDPVNTIVSITAPADNEANICSVLLAYPQIFPFSQSLFPIVEIVGASLNGTFASQYIVWALSTPTLVLLQTNDEHDLPTTTVTPPDGVLIPAMPLCVVGIPTPNIDGIGSGGWTVDNGAAEIYLWNDVSSANSNNRAGAMQEIRDTTSNFIYGIMNLQDTDSANGSVTYIPIRNLRVAEEAEFISFDEQTNNANIYERYRVKFTCQWGLTQ